MSGYGLAVYVKGVLFGRTFERCYELGKLQVASTKCVNVPRLELTAGVFRAKTTNFVVSVFEINSICSLIPL